MSDLHRDIVQAQEPHRRTARDLVESMRGEFEKVLPASLPVETFLRVALTELRLNPTLGQCSAESLLGALMTAARVGLQPGGPLGQFYLTPRRIKDHGWAVVPIVGYQGLRDLAYRSGHVRSIDSILVRDGDTFQEGANEERGHWFDWVPASSVPGERPVVGVLAIADLTTGGRVFRYLDVEEVLARKNRGAAGDKGPWATDTEAMFRKTGIRALSNLLPKSAEYAVAVQADEQVQRYDVEQPAPAPSVVEPPEEGATT